VTVTSTAVDTRARLARRWIAILLIAAGVVACALSLLKVGGLGDVRLLLTMAFLLLGPGWSAAGFLRRAPAAHVWLLAAGVGISVTLIIAHFMVAFSFWRPAVLLYVVTVACVPFLLRHAIVAQ
jgi:hypothetical protein